MEDQVNGGETETQETVTKPQVRQAVMTSNRPSSTRLRELFGNVIPMTILEFLETISLDTPAEEVDNFLIMTSRMINDQRLPRALDVARGVYEMQVAKNFDEAFDKTARGQIMAFWSSIFIAVFNDIDNKEKEKNDGAE